MHLPDEVISQWPLHNHFVWQMHPLFESTASPCSTDSSLPHAASIKLTTTMSRIIFKKRPTEKYICWAFLIYNLGNQKCKLNDCNNFHFNQDIFRQSSCFNRRTCRRIFCEIFCINLIHLIEVVHIFHKYSCFNYVA